MKLPVFSKKLEPKERLLAILVVGAVVIGAVYAMLDSETSVATQVPPKVSGNIASAAQKPVMPIGYQQEMKVKDPFAVAPEYVPPLPPVKVQEPVSKNTSPSNSNAGIQNSPIPRRAVSAEKVTPQPQLPEPRLTGVAGAEGSYVAIIQLGSKSQPYAVNEAVGPYQLISVNENSAILNGPNGQKVIRLGR